MKEFEEEKILEEVSQIYGTNESQNVIKNYADYLKLKRNGKIDFTNYNVFIRNESTYGTYTQLVDAIWKLLKINNITDKPYSYLSIDEIKHCKEKSEDLLVIDYNKIERSILSVKNDIRKYIEEFRNKVFVLIDNSGKGYVNSCLGDLIFWTIEVNQISKENKISYIHYFLDQNQIYLDDKNTFVESLSNEQFWKVKDELLNIVVECKQKGIRTITDSVIKKDLKRKYTHTQQSKNMSNPFKELDLMIGMSEVKRQVKQIVNYIKVNEKRGKLPMLHMCFLGNPRNWKNDGSKNYRKNICRNEITIRKRKIY